MQNNNALQLSPLYTVKEDQTNLLQNALLTKPEDTSAEYNFWQERAKSATGIDKELAEEMMSSLITLKVAIVRLSRGYYNVDLTVKNNDTKKEIPQQTTKVEGFQKKENKPVEKQQPQNYSEKKNEEKKDAEQANKYKEYILTPDAFKNKIIASNVSKEEALEIATYIFGKGRYFGNNPKPWDVAKTKNFVNSIFEEKARKAAKANTENKDKKVESKQQTEKPAESKPTVPTKAEQDKAYKELYGEFENKFSLEELGAKAKEIILENKVEKPLDYVTGLITYILLGGYYTDKKDEGETPREWTAEKIAEFTDLCLSGISSDIAEPGTSEVDKPVEENPENHVDFTIAQAINHVSEQIRVGNFKSEEDVIKWLETNIVIETFSDDVAKDGFETAYNKHFKIVASAQISIKEKKDQEEAKKHNPEVIESVLSNMEQEIIKNKEKVENGEKDFTIGSLITRTRGFLREKGVEMEGGIPALKNRFLEFLNKNNIKAKIEGEKKPFKEDNKNNDKPAEETKSATDDKSKTEKKSSTEGKNVEKLPIIIDLESFDGSKFPEIKAELEACKIASEVHDILKKYKDDHDKVTAAATITYQMFIDKKLANDKKSAEKGKFLDWEDPRIRSFINTAIGRKDTGIKKAEIKNQQAAAEEKVEASSTTTNKEDSKENSDSTADKKDDKSGEENPSADATIQQNTVQDQQNTSNADGKDKPEPKFINTYTELAKAENKDQAHKAIKATIETLINEEKLSLPDAMNKLAEIVMECKAIGQKRNFFRQYKTATLEQIKNPLLRIAKDLKIPGIEDL